MISGNVPVSPLCHVYWSAEMTPDEILQGERIRVMIYFWII